MGDIVSDIACTDWSPILCFSVLHQAPDHPIVPGMDTACAGTRTRLLFQPIPVPNGTRIVALRAVADPAGPPPPLEELVEEACETVASWNRRYPSRAVDLIVDVSGRTLDTHRLDHAIRFALGRTGLGGERLRVSVSGLSDDPALTPVPAARLATLLLPRALRDLPR